MEKAEDRVIDIATLGILGVGGYLLWKFLPEVNTAVDVTKKITDTTEDLIVGTGNVLSDTLSGDFAGATQELYKLPVIGKIGVAVDKFFGSYTPPPVPDYCGEVVKSDMATYIPRMGELQNFNDWRPNQVQQVVDSWVRKGTGGNLRTILQSHMNHLAHGVQGGKGSIVRLELGSGMEGEPVGHEKGVGFKIGVLTKDNVLCHATEYTTQHFLLGFAYYFNQALGDNWYMYSTENRQKMVTTLNDIKFRGDYTVALDLGGGYPDSITMAELRLLDEYAIDVKNDGKGFLTFSLKHIDNPLMKADGTIDWSMLITD